MYSSSIEYISEKLFEMKKMDGKETIKENKRKRKKIHLLLISNNNWD
jgi:hypothetical protein